MMVIHRTKQDAPFLLDDDHVTVAVDGRGFQVHGPDGRETLAWTEITAVRIRTTDAGPLADDVFWEFDTAAKASAVTMTNMARGIHELLETAPRHLPGFDHDAVIAAMGSTDHAVFDVWSRS